MARYRSFHPSVFGVLVVSLIDFGLATVTAASPAAQPETIEADHASFERVVRDLEKRPDPAAVERGEVQPEVEHGSQV